MRADLTVHAVHLGEMRVDVHVRDQVLSMDYPASPGAKPIPLEALLSSLAACAADTLHLVLCRKMSVSVTSLQVDVKAQRREEHPTILTEIELLYRVQSKGLNPEVLERAIQVSEEQLCPVLAMLRPGTRISSSWRIE
ncbi:MAG: OsmC family protein [Terracidiphilus sp.]|jgi:putative redox protein